MVRADHKSFEVRRQIGYSKEMRKIFEASAMAAMIACLGACASASPIEDARSTDSAFKGKIYDGQTTKLSEPLPDTEQFRIFHQGSSSFTPRDAVRRSAMERVRAHCESQNLKPYLIEETASQPPHILGNFPRIEFVFSCVPSKDDRSSETDRYDQLSKLKQLLDSGAITRQEYEREKQRLLNPE